MKSYVIAAVGLLRASDVASAPGGKTGVVVATSDDETKSVE